MSHVSSGVVLLMREPNGALDVSGDNVQTSHGLAATMANIVARWLGAGGLRGDGETGA